MEGFGWINLYNPDARRDYDDGPGLFSILFGLAVLSYFWPVLLILAGVIWVISVITTWASSGVEVPRSSMDKWLHSDNEKEGGNDESNL